ncbi:MAG TPA: TIGR00296 family protein [Nitrososphaerales archaeon]|nr:TIGR00296 family protein [Nitrososphaerales archaeon]
MEEIQRGRLPGGDSLSSKSTNAFTKSDGQLLVGSVRDAISRYLQTRKVEIPKALLGDSRFENKMGCFVTLKANDSEKSLRGCIGFPEPVYKLSWALPHASVAAATEDPRFPPITLPEMENIVTEVSILTVPTQITGVSQREIPKYIRPGVDGLIMRWSYGSGLLLPQVATEYGWDTEEFLCNLSMKAGAPPDQWLVQGTQIYKFQALIFKECEPKGSVHFISDNQK